MIFDKYDKALEYEIFVKKEYSFLDSIIKSSNVIFDIGGHIGLFSKYCLSQNCNLQIQIFEPTENIFLAKKILKKYEKNIIFHNYAIGPKNGEIKFFLTKKSMQNSHYKSFLNKAQESKIFQMKSLNSILTEKVDLLKLDIEGMEFETLLSLDIKNLENIKHIIYEFHLFDEKLEILHQKILKKREEIGAKIQILNGSYTPKIGYILVDL